MAELLETRDSTSSLRDFADELQAQQTLVEKTKTEKAIPKTNL